MNRRLLTVIVPLAAAVLASCSTFDSDTVARVGDQTLSPSELDERLLAIGATQEDLDAVLPAEPVRQAITTWIQESAAGISSDDIVDLYDQGISAAGVACPTLLSTDTVEDATAAAERLRSGEPYDAVFADANRDPQLASVNGSVGCLALADFPDEFRDAPDVVALLAVDASNPFVVAEAPAAVGTIGLVVGFRPFDQLAADEADTVEAAIIGLTTQDIDVTTLDVFVDSRYGTFDRSTGTVVALG